MYFDAFSMYVLEKLIEFNICSWIVGMGKSEYRRFFCFFSWT